MKKFNLNLYIIIKDMQNAIFNHKIIKKIGNSWLIFLPE